MADGTGTETFATGTSAENGVLSPQPAQGVGMRKALLFAGIAAVSIGVAFLVVRAAVRRPPPPDPTTERIQALIDEANRLLRELDDQKRA
jgi:hypothetical protein